jgi:hypothetical protein
VGVFLGLREQGLESDHLKPVLRLEELRKIKKNEFLVLSASRSIFETVTTPALRRFSKHLGVAAQFQAPGR